MDLLDEESIILRIGDLKISDTGDTFGRESFVNGYYYVPLKNTKSLDKNICISLAHGSARRGVLIRKDSTEVFLTYGANRDTSNAQSMAIGFKSDSEYYFLHEYFGDIYEEKPKLSSRKIVRCQSLFNPSENDSIKEIFNALSPKYIETPTDSDEKSFEELMSQISIIEPGLAEQCLNNLRLKERIKRKKINEGR